MIHAKQTILLLTMLCTINFISAQRPQQQNQQQQTDTTSKKIRTQLCVIGSRIANYTNNYPLSFDTVLSIKDTSRIQQMINELTNIDNKADSLDFNYLLHPKYFLKNEKWVPQINELLIELKSYKSFIKQQDSTGMFEGTIKYSKPACCDSNDQLSKPILLFPFWIKLDSSLKNNDTIVLKSIKKYICCAMSKLYDSLYNNLNQINSNLNNQHNEMQKYMQSIYRYQMFATLVKKFEDLEKAGIELQKNCNKK
jgi:hypothetical protein